MSRHPRRRRIGVATRASIGLALLAGLASPRALAAQCTTTQLSGAGRTAACTITVAAPNPTAYTNPMLLSLTASAGSSSFTIDEAAYRAGQSATRAVTISVRGNRAWAVTMHGPATWTGTGPVARVDKPVGDLRWSTTAAGTGTAMSVTPATVANGGPGATTSTTLYFATLLSWTGDPPGDYTIAVTLTLTAP